MPRKFPPETHLFVCERASYLCEYRHTSEFWQAVRFTLDHVLPVAAGGEDIEENLALACFHCNRRKADKQSAVDAETGETIPIFNPRQHNWADHFIWSADGLRILPQTAIGRVTISLLELNRERILFIRAADASVDRHPPTGDSIQEPEKS